MCPSHEYDHVEHPMQITEGVYKESNKLTMYIIPPSEKVLACGDIGKGAMAHVGTICDAILSQIDSAKFDANNNSEDETTHPTLQPGWIIKYKWNPIIRLKYWWRYSRVCTLQNSTVVHKCHCHTRCHGLFGNVATIQIRTLAVIERVRGTKEQTCRKIERKG